MLKLFAALLIMLKIYNYFNDLIKLLSDLHEKKDFVKASKNLARYRFENNFVGAFK